MTPLISINFRGAWKNTHFHKRLLLVAALFFFFVGGASEARAASLYFSPTSGSYAVGDEFSVSIFVSSSDQAMNAASGVISFPADKLELTSLSKAGSISSLWVQEPSFSNADGTLTFEGIVLNPGFTGAAGKFITANFKIKAAGLAALSFSSGSVLANDGKGTNILSDLGKASYSLGGAVSPISVGALGGPAAPEISSATHPDQNKWYAKKDAYFTWPLPKDVTAVRLLVGKIPRATPTIIYAPAISEKLVTALDNGVSYFHAQFRNKNGWGDVAHYKVQVDTEKPSSFTVTEVAREDPTTPKASFLFSAHDAISGIDYYEISIDGQEALPWRDDGSHRYETPTLSFGKHKMVSRVLDRAGNFLEVATEFTIAASSAPTIAEYTKYLQSGETLIIRGFAAAGSQVTIWAESGGDTTSYAVTTDKKGKFSFISEKKWPDGVYHIWAEDVDKRGAHSAPSEKVTVVISQSAILQFGSLAINFLAVFMPLVALVIILLGLLWYGWHKLTLFKKRLKREVREAESILHKAFDLLKEDIREHIRLLEKTRTKRQLTLEEDKIVKQLKRDMDEAERLVQKEMEEIDREVS